MKALARFQLSESDELAAEVCDLESGLPLLTIHDDPADNVPFQLRVARLAESEGHEVVEWDRSALS